ncbi:unnamed protein product [Prunus armeniaca]|uniref:Uncharacterized protein n=1 Tax=Prunus armeniaca TaxID=36596 RepID=A0A6J5XCB4_PRUAR|nr:unnamed protein product [Prunus armeniaca]CAB4311359.1 unnamed protein product [Prunus armeniaca]
MSVSETKYQDKYLAHFISNHPVFIDSCPSKIVGPAECGCSKEAGCYYEYAFNGVIRCAFPNRPKWPPLLQIPAPEYWAVRSEVALAKFTSLQG